MGFQWSGPTSHKWVIHSVAGLGEAGDEELWQLRLEAGPVGNFVEAVCLPLAARPIFIERFHGCSRTSGRRPMKLLQTSMGTERFEGCDGADEVCCVHGFNANQPDNCFGLFYRSVEGSGGEDGNRALERPAGKLAAALVPRYVSDYQRVTGDVKGFY